MIASQKQAETLSASTSKKRKMASDRQTGLDQLTEVLADLDDKREPAERRIINRTLFNRITTDDEENTAYIPDETTASVLPHTSIDATGYSASNVDSPY